MNELSAALSSVMERMKRFRSLYEQNEMAVRDQIVNPLLRVLGWDPEDPEEVQPNVSTEEGVPDYSLMKNGKKILFLEAKKLSVDIERREVISQLARYSFAEGTKYGVLTNGAIWILVRSFQEGTTLGERIVWKLDLENEEFPSVSRRLTTISKFNVDQIETLVKKAQILHEIWQTLVDEPEEMIRALMPVIKSTLAEGYPDYAFDDAEIDDLLRERIKEMVAPAGEPSQAVEIVVEPVVRKRGERPRRMSLSGEQFELRNAFEILVHTAEWLIRRGKLKASDCPIGIGHKRNLVNLQPKHKYGDDFRAPRKLSNGLWIETHYSTAGCINTAKRLLERFGYPPSSISIE